MKKFLFLFVILMLGFNLMYATEYDTLYVREDNKIIKKIVPIQEKIIEEINFKEGVDPKIFTYEDILSLEKGKKIKKEDTPFNFPVVPKDYIFLNYNSYYNENIYKKVGDEVMLVDSSLKKRDFSSKIDFFVYLTLYLSVLVFGFLSAFFRKGGIYYLSTVFLFFLVYFIIILFPGFLMTELETFLLLSIFIIGFLLFCFSFLSKRIEKIKIFDFKFKIIFIFIFTFVVSLVWFQVPNFFLSVNFAKVLNLDLSFAWNHLCLQVIIFLLGFVLRESVLFYRNKIRSD